MMPEIPRSEHSAEAGQNRARPGVWLTLITVAFIALTVALGQWQTHRAAEKSALWQAVAERSGQPAQSLDVIMRLAPEERAGRLIRIEGQWVDGYTLLIDNRIQAHRPGYDLISLMRLVDGQSMVLINRGWIAAKPDRSQVNVPALTPGVVSVVGRLMVPDEHRFSLGTPEYPAPHGALTQWPSLSITRFHSLTGLSVLPLAIEQTEGEADGLARNWPGPPDDADRHRAYALQWYCFGLIAAGIYAYRWRTRARQSAAHAALADEVTSQAAMGSADAVAPGSDAALSQSGHTKGQDRQ